MNSKGSASIVIGIIAALVIVGALGYFTFVRDNEPTDTGTTTDINGDLGTSTNGDDNSGTKTVRNAYITGFEGDNTRVTYELSHPANITVETSAQTPSLITIREGGRTHTVTIFNNVGAGFANSQEAYEGAGGRDYCTGCVSSNPNFSPKGGSDIRAWSSSSREVIVYAQAPGFVILKLAKPSDPVKRVLETLTIKAEKVTSNTGNNQTTTLKLYFQNTRLQKDTNSCEEVFAVTRTIPLTATPATVAINLLLQGPTVSERAQGYSTVIPTGSKLNTVSINNGVARADFNSTTESGGGSCAMIARTAQISKTLMQFPSVASTRLTVDGKQTDESFQP